MAPNRTGTIARTKHGLRLRISVTLRHLDGTLRSKRVWVDPEAELTDEQARAMAAQLTKHYLGRTVTQEELDRGLLGGNKPTTVALFVRKVYLPTRVDQDTFKLQTQWWEKHILPVIGHHDVHLFEPDHLRSLVSALDEKILDDRTKFGWKTAQNVWGLVTRFCSDLAEHKERRIRIRRSNVAKGVRGPERGDRASKQWLYPSELRQLLDCQLVPVSRRRTWALLVYCFARAGEVAALDWDRVDIEHQVLTIDRARGLRSGKLALTKTHDVRTFPIEPVLLPMLAAMKAERAQFTGSEAGARLLREDLTAAGIDRRELFERQGTSLPITQHDLRATGITYLAMRGDQDDEVRERAGHSDFKMTLVYLRRGRRMKSATLGAPFDPLPSSLLERSERVYRVRSSNDSSTRLAKTHGTAGNLRAGECEGKDLNLSQEGLSSGKQQVTPEGASGLVAKSARPQTNEDASLDASPPRVFSAAALALAGLAFRLGVLTDQAGRAA